MKLRFGYGIFALLSLVGIALVVVYVNRAINDPDPLVSWIIAAGWAILFGVLLTGLLRSLLKMRNE